MKLLIQYLPNYQNEWPEMAFAKAGDSGMDLRAAVPERVVIAPKSRMVVPNGISCQLQAPTDTYEIQVRPRSGLAAKKGIMVVNTPGTVDWGYRGEIMTILFNSSDEPFEINPGDRIAQMVVCPIVRPEIERVTELDETERGSTGFGSSGHK